MANSLEEILAEARACTICAEHLPLGPRPVVRAGVTSRLVIIGQAPGTRVHETGSAVGRSQRRSSARLDGRA